MQNTNYDKEYLEKYYKNIYMISLHKSIKYYALTVWKSV